MFDRVAITCIAGKGGDGCVSFRREKYIPKGGPNGGDGGRGGNVILRSSDGLSDFSCIGHKKEFRAADGENGRPAMKKGRDGDDCVIDVPVGTIARETEYNSVIKEFTCDKQSVIVAQGGKGGKGNTAFANSVNQVPREYGEGRKGETIRLKLDLKMIADIGIVGYPNAGKSTLLNMLTGASPKIASYPFTTLDPKIGTLIFENYEDAVVADIPGLIADASKGAGLGNRFLKHIERTELLLHVVEIDPSEPDNSPFESYKNLRKELEEFSSPVAEKEELIVLNKIDRVECFDSEEKELIRSGREVFPVSAKFGTGIEALKKAIQRHINDPADDCKEEKIGNFHANTKD